MLALLEFDTNAAFSESSNESAIEPRKTDINGPKIRRKIKDIVTNCCINFALLLAQKAIIKEVIYKVDINTIKRIEDNKDLNMNDICKVKIRTTAQMMVDEYLQNRSTGGFILVDESTNETVAAGMIMN